MAGNPNRPPQPAPPIRTALRLDVSDAVALPGTFEVAASLIAPATVDPEREQTLLVCLPGGFLSRHYYDLEIDGDRRYSFAEAMTSAGYLVLAIDHIGVGESSKPDPIELGYELGVEAIARANQAALDQAIEALGSGRCSQDLPPIPRLRSLGVGHSMGSALSVEQQAAFAPHDALILFSFSTAGVPRFLTETQRGYIGDPIRARAEIGRLARESMGSPYPAHATQNTDNAETAFGVGTAPAQAQAALQKASTNLLAVGGLLSMLPGGYQASADQIRVPVLVAVGDHDLQDDSGLEAMLPAAPRVDTFMLPDCWHCHFVANTREQLWARVLEWVGALEGGH